MASASFITLFNIVAVFRRSASSERGDVAAYRVELEHAYRNAHPSMKALLSMLDLGRRQAVGDRDPIRHWHKGRVVRVKPPALSPSRGPALALDSIGPTGRALPACLAATCNASLRSALDFPTALPDRLNAAPAFHLAPPSKTDLRLKPESVIDLANRETNWPEFFDRH
jgi:hypothetical protein